MGYVNYEWFLKQDFSEFAGNWVAIVDKKVVASGKNVEKIIKKVKIDYPRKRPFITRVKDKLSIL